MIKGLKYSKTSQKEFSATLHQRVNSYFSDNGIDQHAGQHMILKSILLFGLYAGIYLVIITGTISSISFLFLLWALLGLTQSLIGMCVMHDAVHGAYTKNRFGRKILEIPILAIGVEPRIWRIEHNILHHTYPNVEGVDQDIHPRTVFRFTVHQTPKWFHAYQHIYATFFYALLIIEWLTVKDILKAMRYHRMGFFKSPVETIRVILVIVVKKLVFYFMFLFLPLQFLPIDSLLIVGMFLTMLVVAGLSMAIIFQLAHVVPHCHAEDNAIQLAGKNWHVHQLESTCDFAHGNKLLSYLIGGLNYQIEHHLFPNICHVHYPAISPIIKQTAKEFGIPFHYEETFIGAIRAHYTHLKNLGKG